MTLLFAIASDVGVMLLVTLNGMKLLPRSNEAVVSLDDDHKDMISSSPRWQKYQRLSSENVESSVDDVELV